MADTHCTEQGLGMGPESKWVTIFYAELFTLHWNMEQDLTPLGFIQFFPFLVPVPCSVSEPLGNKTISVHDNHIQRRQPPDKLYTYVVCHRAYLHGIWVPFILEH